MIGRLIQWLKRKWSGPYTLPPSPVADDMPIMESSVLHYFEHSPDPVHIIAYDPAHQDAISALRIKGWKISLAISVTGELHYVVHKKTTDAVDK